MYRHADRQVCRYVYRHVGTSVCGMGVVMGVSMSADMQCVACTCMHIYGTIQQVLLRSSSLFCLVISNILVTNLTFQLVMSEN